MLIGALAAATGTVRGTLRFYEDEGLLPAPARTAGGYRDYDDGAMDRVRFIRQTQGAGLTLAQIREILANSDAGRPPCAQVARAIDERLAVVEERIAHLQRTRDELVALGHRVSDVGSDSGTARTGFCPAVAS